MQRTSKDKGEPTCPDDGEVISLGGSRDTWSSLRNNANNAWYVNMNNGNMNNNNTYNRYVTAGVSELSEDVIERYLLDEQICYSNKHDSYEAARFHYKLSEVLRLAEEVENRTWKQGRAIVFAISYPTWREVWASDYKDRILHHDVAHLLYKITERYHTTNGDVSHGNRLNHSAHTAALQIMLNMQKFEGGFVGKRDISGFFMTIDKRRACDMILADVESEKDRWLLDKLITHNPTGYCDIRSPQCEMDMIPRNKSLFHAKEGFGLPIGNFYSQLTANVYLQSVDALANTKWRGLIGYTRFVDDICVVAETVEDVNRFFADAKAEIERLGLRLNEKKCYLQPIGHGVSFCGRTIHDHGIYINNRTVRACKNAIRSAPEGLEGAKKVVRSLNSYFGFFKHCKAFNIQKRLAEDTRQKYGCYIKERLKGKQIVFSICSKYTDKTKAKMMLENYKLNIKTIKYEIRENRKREPRHRRGRRRKC